MFNVIVSNTLSPDGNGTIGTDRVFEHTSEALKERFAPEGALDVQAVLGMPTLFMEEGKRDEVAWVGSLSSVERESGRYRLQFTVEPNLPRLTNREVFSMADALGMNNFQFSRNHWSIKDGDLYRVLLRHQFASRFEPTVFSLPQNPVRRKLVSLMMPFDAGFAPVHTALRDTIVAEGFECQRADDIWINPHIVQDIVHLITTSRVVVCDLSGKNPNVFYEAGIAHTLGKEVILITQSADDVPFDLRAVRFITYHNNGEGRDRLAEKVMNRIETVTADD